jgi:subtilisin family serine protease
MRRATTVALLALAVFAPAAGAAERTGRWLAVFESEATVQSSSLLSSVLARTGVERAGRGVPPLGVATVDGSPSAIARLRRDPAVKSVSAEWRRDLRRTPNDPSLTQQQAGAPAGTAVQWWLARSGFPAAWDATIGSDAIVGVLDTGLDGEHPQLSSKVASADAIGTLTGPLVDEDGHGTHVSGLACAATGDASGIAGAGWNCRIAVVKIAFRDEDIVAGIHKAVERGAHAINMSFGGGDGSSALATAIDFAVQRGVVLVAAASNDPITDQGPPASQLQPGDASDIGAGKGLVVTGVDFRDRHAGTGSGGQISLGAYGFYERDAMTGPLGLLSTYPDMTQGEVPPLVVCGCRATFNGDDRYAYLDGTSMAAPQVTATAAMIGELNPFLTAPEKIRIIKETARRAGGWTPEFGWGILDAGKAIDAARRVDKRPPQSQAGARRKVRAPSRGRVRVRVSLSGSDDPAAAGLVPSGVRSFDLYMKRGRGQFRRVRKDVTGSPVILRLRPGVFRFYTRAIDAAGNREAAPARADVRMKVRRR